MESESNSTHETSESETDEKTRRDIVMIEAALYVAGRPLDLKTLGYIIGTRSKRRVQQLARTLMEEYERRDMALEVLELEDHRFVLQLKQRYSSKVRRLAIRPLLGKGPLKTLSYIAYKQPVMQKQVIDVRGGHAYSHIKDLIDMGLVEYEKSGKTRILKTTDYFSDYFSLSRDPKKMKHQLQNIFDSLMKEAIPPSKKTT